MGNTGESDAWEGLAAEAWFKERIDALPNPLSEEEKIAVARATVAQHAYQLNASAIAAMHMADKHLTSVLDALGRVGKIVMAHMDRERSLKVAELMFDASETALDSFVVLTSLIQAFTFDVRHCIDGRHDETKLAESAGEAAFLRVLADHGFDEARRTDALMALNGAYLRRRSREISLAQHNSERKRQLERVKEDQRRSTTSRPTGRPPLPSVRSR